MKINMGKVATMWAPPKRYDVVYFHQNNYSYKYQKPSLLEV